MADAVPDTPAGAMTRPDFPPDRPPHIMLVAGEASGDLLGAQLMVALRELTGGAVRLSGVGGPAMEARGLKSLFDIADTSIMGFTEVVPAIPRVFKRIRQTVAYALETRPDLVVLIDSPDFTFRVARGLTKHRPSLPIVKYVAPQVWASRAFRAKKLARIVDCVMTLLPFEPPWFERVGLRAICVGHPVVERAQDMRGGAVFRTRHAIAPDTPLLLVLPGSRRHEVMSNLPLYRATVHRLRKRVPGVQVVIPAVPHLEEMIRTQLKRWAVPALVVPQDEKFAAFDAADAALAVSGTVSVELSLAGVPTVVTYRFGRLTGLWVKLVVKVPFASLLNLVEGVGIIPEYIQEAARPEVLVDDLESFLIEPEVARRQRQRLRKGMEHMGLGQDPPSFRAAKAVLDMLGQTSTRSKRAKRPRRKSVSQVAG